jgi:hypothetical protein
VTQRKDRTFFSDGVVYVSGPGYEAEERDLTRFEDNTYLASPGEQGVQSFRMLYVDGYTGLCARVCGRGRGVAIGLAVLS